MSHSSTDRMTTPSGDAYAEEAEKLLRKLDSFESCEEQAELILQGRPIAREFREWIRSAPPLEIRGAKIDALMTWARKVHELGVRQTLLRGMAS